MGTDQTNIVCSEESIDKTMLTQSKKPIKKLLSYIVTMSDQSGVTQSEIFNKCGVTAEQFENALGCVEKNVFILYKRKPCEANIGPYST